MTSPCIATIDGVIAAFIAGFAAGSMFVACLAVLFMRPRGNAVRVDAYDEPFGG